MLIKSELIIENYISCQNKSQCKDKYEHITKLTICIDVKDARELNFRSNKRPIKFGKSSKIICYEFIITIT